MPSSTAALFSILFSHNPIELYIGTRIQSYSAQRLILEPGMLINFYLWKYRYFGAQVGVHHA